MDIFKKSVGFILLAVAAWMITVVSQEQRSAVLFYSLVLAFCVWMWGGWVGFGSKTSNDKIGTSRLLQRSMSARRARLELPVSIFKRVS
jgi:thiol:disulfide interchange protein